MQRTPLRAAVMALILLGGLPAARACPDEQAHAAAPVALQREGRLWELQLPAAALHELARGRRDALLAAKLSPVLVEGLLQGAALLSLIDEVGRHQGVVVVGVGDQLPVTVAPRGRSPFKQLLALQLAMRPAQLRDLSVLAAPASAASEQAQRAYGKAVEQVVPGRAQRRAGHAYGKVVASECIIGAWERLLLLLLDHGQVALLSHAGFLRYDPARESRLSADGQALTAQARWTLERPDPYTISLRSAEGTYLQWGAGDYFELDAARTEVPVPRVFQDSRERFFLWQNADGTSTLKLPNNRVSVSVAEWDIPRQGYGTDCHYYGYRQDPAPNGPRLSSISLGSPP